MENVNLLPENEYKEVEGRSYLNPNLPVERTNAFIDNLRSTQQANNQEINTQTQQLGTDVPSNLGGLTGAGSYFTSRYQTPQTNAVVQGLRTAAQSAALSQALENEQAMWKKRYQDAYRNYQKREHDKANKTNSVDPYKNPEGEDPDYETTTPAGTSETSVSGMSGKYTLVSPDGKLHIVDMNTRDEEVLSPGEKSQTTKKASAAVGGGEIRTLPNGHTVLVKPGYGLTKDNGKYYLVNTSTGARTEVGGY